MAIRLVKLTSIIAVLLVVLMGVTLRLGFETNHFEAFWSIVQFTGCFSLIVGIWYLVAPPHRAVSRNAPANRSVEDRLDELERLKRREMVTMEEYAAKRLEILKDL